MFFRNDCLGTPTHPGGSAVTISDRTVRIPGRQLQSHTKHQVVFAGVRARPSTSLQGGRSSGGVIISAHPGVTALRGEPAIDRQGCAGDE